MLASQLSMLVYTVTKIPDLLTCSANSGNTSLLVDPSVKVIKHLRLKYPNVPHSWDLGSNEHTSIWDQGTLVGLKCPPLDAVDRDNGNLLLIDTVDPHSV